MEGDLGLSKKIDGLNRTTNRVLKYAVPSCLSQDSAVTRTRVALDKPFVREEKERLVFSAPIRFSTFAKSRSVDWPSNVKTIVVLPQYRFWRAIEIIEPGI